MLKNLIKKHRTIFLPDIGTFFDNDTKKASRIIDRISKLKLPVIKGEILHNADICLNGKFNETYFNNLSGKMNSVNFRKLIERKVISLKNYEKIFKGIPKKTSLILSVYDFEGLDFALDQKCVAIKIASSNITHKPLIEYAAKKSKSLIIDTGHSTIEEISRAINWARDKSSKLELILQHSPKAPPNPVNQQNLLFMKNLGSIFNVQYGLSDHHYGEEMLYAATALGAVVVEKGVCEDNSKQDQDRAHALNLSKVKEVNEKIINIANSIGDGTRYLRKDRKKYNSRMCLVAKKNIIKGEKITLEKLRFAFPPIGIGVEDIDFYLGKIINVNKKKGLPLLKKDF